MRMSKRALALALALITMLALAAPALAAEQQMYATTGLNVRKGPGTSYAIVGELEKGDVVTVTSRTGNWAYITYDGNAKGYASLTYLKAYTGSGTAATGATMYITSPVNVRGGPGTSYSKVGELTKGDAVSRVGTTGAWSIIEWKGGTAYVSSAYLSAVKPGSGSTGSTGSMKLQATAGVNVRKGPGTGYAIAGTLDRGDIVYSTGVISGSWTQITFNGQTAYVSSAYLKPVGVVSSSGSSATTMYCTTDNTRVYDRASTGSLVRGYLDKGQAVTVLGESGYWATIQYGSRICYVRSYYLSDGEYEVTSRTGVVYATSSVRVRSGPGSSYENLGYLYSGESAERTGVTGSWTQIDYKGRTGYVLTSQVKAISLSSMKSYNGYMYATSSRTYAYSIPSTSSAYREGYFKLGESVYVVAYNSSWAQVEEDGSTLYVQMKFLEDENTSGNRWQNAYDRVWLPRGADVYNSRYDYYSNVAPDFRTTKGRYVYITNEYRNVFCVVHEDGDEIGWVHIRDIDEDDSHWYS